MIKVLQVSLSLAAEQGLLGLNSEFIHTIIERAVQRSVDRRGWEASSWWEWKRRVSLADKDMRLCFLA